MELIITEIATVCVFINKINICEVIWPQKVKIKAELFDDAVYMIENSSQLNIQGIV